MEMNYLVILGATVIAFFISFLWFGPLFGNMWMEIHGFTKKDMEAEKAYVWKLLILEFITTFALMCTLAFFIKQSPAYYEMAIAFFIWLGIILPYIISGVIWGWDKKSEMVRKICILSAHSLVVLLLAGFIFSMWL